jgi:type I restriction enzyme R subunit
LLTFLRNQGKFFHAPENRELDLILIDYAQPERNAFEVTEEFYWHNGRYGNREGSVPDLDIILKLQIRID